MGNGRTETEPAELDVAAEVLSAAAAQIATRVGSMPSVYGHPEVAAAMGDFARVWSAAIQIVNGTTVEAAALMSRSAAAYCEVEEALANLFAQLADRDVLAEGAR